MTETQTAPKPRIFRFAGLDPMKMPPPIGDRYLMEVFDFEEEQLSCGLFLPPDDEERAGWVPAIIIAVGNGMVLDQPPHHFVLPSDLDRSLPLEKKQEILASSVSPQCPVINEVSMVYRVHQQVPMVLQPGQEIIVEKYSGRKYRMLGRNFRTMAQVDCLQPTGRFFDWDQSLGWVERG